MCINLYIGKYYAHAVVLTSMQIVKYEQVSLNTHSIGEGAMEDVMNGS